jgi:sporulation protein YlmC with PRC-barrel domain
MNRFLITTAVGLFLGATPALAQDQAPQDENMSPPAIQSPASPSEAPSVIDKSMSPSTENSQPPSEDAPSPQSSEAAPQSPSTEAPSPQSSEAAPQSIAPPDQSAVNEAPSATGADRFLSAQQSSDYLASTLIGETVVNAKNETIGDINDLVTDKDGNVIAVLVRAGSFLGIGGKDIGVPFKDLNIARDANNDLTVLLNVDQDAIAAAPDYQRLDEQQMVESSNKTDREESPRTY